MARLLFFGKLGEAAGGRERMMVLPPEVTTIRALLGKLAMEDTYLGETLNGIAVRYVVNEQIVGAEAAIADGDEIAFLPPVSGG